MDDSRGTRLVAAVLRCYPARWRRRHGDEAAELAARLIENGTPAAAIAWSYLAGATRERLTPRPSRRLSTAACALLVAACALGASTVLLTPPAPARAASTSQPRGRPAHCSGPAPAWPVPGVTRTTARTTDLTTGRRQAIFWEDIDDRSC